MRLRTALTWAILAVAVVACGQGMAATTTTTTIVGPTTTTPPSEAPDPVADAAVADLAERLDVPEADIEVVRSTAVSWPDGAIGCPEPGVMYTQAIVEGHQVILSAGDRYFDYHADSRGEPFMCESDAEDGGHDTPPAAPGTTS